MLGLVLSGGAAKGYAHIGVIKFLEEEGIKPDIIVGASMGALVGGINAAGINASTLEEIALGVDKRTKKWLFRLHISRKGLIDTRNIIRYIIPYIRNKKIEELPTKFAAVTTDIENHSEIILAKGSLIKAIRAAISIPVLFIPRMYNGRLLIDGGFVNPLPITVARKLGAQQVIAVNVLNKKNYKQSTLSDVIPKNKTYNVKEIFMELAACITSRLIDYELMHLKDGILMNIDTTRIGFSQFEKARNAIDQGYREAQRYCKTLKRIKFK